MGARNFRVRQHPQARRAARQADLLATFDADADGALSDAERAAMRESRAVDLVARLDADGDGRLSVAEFVDGRRGGRRGPPPELLDADGDGYVTAEELMAARPPRGERGDRRPRDDDDGAAPAPR